MSRKGPPKGRKLMLVLGLGALVALGVIRFVGGGDDDATGSAEASTTAAVFGTQAGSAEPTATTPATPTTTRAATTTRAVEGHGLIEAVEAGLVEVEFRSSGGASGDVVELLIRRLAEAGEVTLEVTVPSGLLLANPAAGEQDLVVAGLEGRMTGPDSYLPADEMRLADGEWHTYLLEAYCAEAHDANPSAGGPLLLGEMAGPALVAALGALDEAGVRGDVVVVQAVVWAVTDDITAGELAAVGYGLDGEGLERARRVIEAAGLDPGSYRLFAG